MIADETEDLIVEIPSDEIELGHDKDGLPKTVPTEKAKAATLVADDDAPRRKKDKDAAAELEAERARAERLQAERDQIAQERETERAARTKAEEQRDNATAWASNSHWARIHAEHQQITSGIAATKQFLDQAKRELAETDDGSRRADLTEQIGTAAANLAALEHGRVGAEAEIERTKRAFAEQPKPAEQEPRREQPKQPSPDEWIADVRSKVGDKVADWLDSHREYVTNPKLNAKVIAFSQAYATIKEKPLNSQAFLDALETELGLSEPDTDVDPDTETEPELAVEEEAPKPKAKRAPAAPVSRNSHFFSSKNPNGGKIKLPADIAAFVKSAGLDPTQYALGVLDDIRAGRKPKEWLDPDFDRGVR